MEEIKVIYYIEDGQQDTATPFLTKLPISADKVTLIDLKDALSKHSWKYFFKSMDDDFGVVKEEISDDSAALPCANGRVVCWLVPSSLEAAAQHKQYDEGVSGGGLVPGNRGVGMSGERMVGVGESRAPSFHNVNVANSQDSLNEAIEALDTFPADESLPPPPLAGAGFRQNRGASRGPPPHKHSRSGRKLYSEAGGGGGGGGGGTGSSMVTSDFDTTSFFDSEDDASSRFTMTTETTSRSSKLYGLQRKKRRKHRMPPSPMSRTSSISSITDSTMSLNVINVTLNMDTVNFLGISIVGQSNKNGDGGIYVGSIMKGGAVAQDGRVEPGDMILEVNGTSFENMSNDDAVRTLREAVQRPGPITLVVAKCWDPTPKEYFTVPRQEPVRPIDPSAWVAHTAALRGDYAGSVGGGPGGVAGRLQPISPPSISGLTTNSSSLNNSAVTATMPPLDNDRLFPEDLRLNVNTDYATIIRFMQQPDSGLEIRDRMWLKITIPNAFIGSDLVDWLYQHLEGFADRRDARKFACSLLKLGYIRHTVNKITFSEQCYYVFNSDLISHFSSLALDDDDADSISQVDRDTLAPLPPPTWTHQYNFSSSQSYLGPPANSYISMAFTNDSASYTNYGGGGGGGGTGHVGHVLQSGGGGGSSVGGGGPPTLTGGSAAGSIHSGSGGSDMSDGGKSKTVNYSDNNSCGAGSDTETQSVGSGTAGGGGTATQGSPPLPPPLPPPPGALPPPIQAQPISQQPLLAQQHQPLVTQQQLSHMSQDEHMLGGGVGGLPGMMPITGTGNINGGGPPSASLGLPGATPHIQAPPPPPHRQSHQQQPYHSPQQQYIDENLSSNTTTTAAGSGVEGSANSRPIATVPQDLSSSRQSFKRAMGNPSILPGVQDGW